MKIRTGFVSNSSSSSFVAVLAKDDFNKLLETLTPVAKTVISYLQIENKKLNNTEMIVYSAIEGNASFDPLFERVDKIEFLNKVLALADNNSELFEKLQDAIKQFDTKQNKKPFRYDDAEVEAISIYEDGLIEFGNALLELEKNNKCITITEDF
jgi:hypothetical protein